MSRSRFQSTDLVHPSSIIHHHPILLTSHLSLSTASALRLPLRAAAQLRPSPLPSTLAALLSLIPLPCWPPLLPDIASPLSRLPPPSLSPLAPSLTPLSAMSSFHYPPPPQPGAPPPSNGQPPGAHRPFPLPPTLPLPLRPPPPTPLRLPSPRPSPPSASGTRASLSHASCCLRPSPIRCSLPSPARRLPAHARPSCGVPPAAAGVVPTCSDGVPTPARCRVPSTSQRSVSSSSHPAVAPVASAAVERHDATHAPSCRTRARPRVVWPACWWHADANAFDAGLSGATAVAVRWCSVLLPPSAQRAALLS